MDYTKIHYYEKIENTDHREFIESQSHCALCSQPLELRHVRSEDFLIKEEAYCNHCDLRARNKDYKLN